MVLMNTNTFYFRGFRSSADQNLHFLHSNIKSQGTVRRRREYETLPPPKSNYTHH